MINFLSPAPDHHSFKGSIPKSVIKKHPFITELDLKSGIKVNTNFEMYILNYKNFSLKVWTDGKNNFWFEIDK